MNYKFGGTFILLLAGLLVLTIIFGSWYTIDQTQRGVLLRNGALVEVVQPGLHFKWPWIEAVNKVDMQTHNFTFEKVNSYSADQQPADLRISVTLHVAPDKVAEMYSRFGGDQQAAISRLITPHMNQEVKVVFGQYTAQRHHHARVAQRRRRQGADRRNRLRSNLRHRRHADRGHRVLQRLHPLGRSPHAG